MGLLVENVKLANLARINPLELVFVLITLNGGYKLS